MKPAFEYNHIGWLAIRHKDGWWLGKSDGVPCYPKRDIARAALTIVWQMDGGKKMNFHLEPFTGVNKDAGKYEMKKTGAKALRDYEARFPKMP
jgi:hypothetical protein